MANKNPRPAQGLGSRALSQRLFITSCLAFSCSILASVSPADATTGGMTLEGVNISGGEFNQTTVPGVYNTNYIYPSNAEIDYFASKGMTVIRVPFSWERMQQSVNGPLDPAELGRLDAVVNYVTSKGLSTVLDPHDYGSYQNVTVGVPGGQPNSMFADFWSKMASHYSGNPKVIFGLMNEPVGSQMTADTWLASAQAAIDAIRATGSTNLILVPSTYWMHAVNFVDVNASVMIKINDPANNFSYEVHQYLDYDGSGTHTDFPPVADAVAMLTNFTNWLKANNRTAFLGEIGVTTDPGACADLAAMLQYMHANSAQWTGFTYWTAGQWYPADYIFLVEPQNGQDTPQMQTIVANLGATTPPPTTPPPPPPPPPAPPPPPPPPPTTPPPPPPTTPPPTTPPPTTPPPTTPPPTTPPPTTPPPTTPPPTTPPPTTPPPTTPPPTTPPPTTPPPTTPPPKTPPPPTTPPPKSPPPRGHRPAPKTPKPPELPRNPRKPGSSDPIKRQSELQGDNSAPLWRGDNGQQNSGLGEDE